MEWPSSRNGLVFFRQTLGKGSGLSDVTGSFRSVNLKTRRKTRFNHAGALVLAEDANDILLRACRASNALTAEQLSWALGISLDRIVVNAGGSHTTREQLAREMSRGHDRLKGKRVVICQFTAQELLSGDWKHGELPAIPSTTPAVSVPTEKFRPNRTFLSSQAT